MKISVIIPMYNASETIVRVLNSVKNQTLKCDYEILVINDGSKDNSKEIVEKYISENSGSNIILIDQLNGGVSTARNAGLRASKGELIAFLDSDDEWFPDKLEKQKQILNNNPEKKERDVILEFENLTKEIQSYDHSKDTLGEACMVGDMEKLITSM